MNGKQLKNSILQWAIQGRLVPQAPTDEPASVLLQRIQAEKARLVKEGKLKKSALSDSTIFLGEDNKYYEKVGKTITCIDEDIPFEIPQTWEWVRGEQVFKPMESTMPQGDFTYVDVDAVDNKNNIIKAPKFLKQSNAPSRATRKLHKNDILFSKVRPYLRNIALVTQEYQDAIGSTGFYVVTPTIAYYPKYLFYLMLSSYVVDGINAFIKGHNSPSVNDNHITRFLFPLPPLAEQHRIVAKLEELFAVLDRLACK